ncbi:hypothetical protein K7X08_032559 [Anisodus acutangulus]|uniref:Uncharacterized protein n=1 Tax=Anisodus acutangulus TaxID=402998 RepID=A0A9Q1N0N2_9SOLA|nr:hypothetical protein K7X08_032559 [Anisodus acutangulus]
MALMFNLRLILATLLLLGMWASLATSRTLFEVSIAEKHEQWVVQHGRVYKDDIEKAERHKTLRQNHEHIESVNKAGTRTYKLGINEFTDMTNEEFQATHNGYKMLSYKKIKTTSFSYLYQGIDGTCNIGEETNNVVKITGYENVPINNELALLNAVANQLVSVAIDASGSDFQLYSSGVFTRECGTELDHGVTAVGYGETSDGTKYWVVKNSRGTSWGREWIY